MFGRKSAPCLAERARGGSHRKPEWPECSSIPSASGSSVTGRLATTCLLAMLPAWRGLPLRTHGVWDAALGYLIVAVAVGVVIHDINAPRSLGRAGRLSLAAAPILILNC